MATQESEDFKNLQKQTLHFIKTHFIHTKRLSNSKI